MNDTLTNVSPILLKSKVQLCNNRQYNKKLQQLNDTLTNVFPILLKSPIFFLKPKRGSSEMFECLLNDTVHVSFIHKFFRNDNNRFSHQSGLFDLVFTVITVTIVLGQHYHKYGAIFEHLDDLGKDTTT